MLQLRNAMISVSALLIIAACTQIPQQAYFNRGDPDGLIEASQEAVNIEFGNASGMHDLEHWVNRRVPTQSELFCMDSESSCQKAKRLLGQFNVPYRQTAIPRNLAVLQYTSVAARDCEHRYIDNSINPYNLNHPAFGCSVASNIVQSVSERTQFVNPSLMDGPDGEKAVQNYREYQKAPSERQKATATTSTLDAISSGGGGQGGSGR